MEGLTPAIVKNEMKYFSVPGEQAWRIPMLRELVDGKFCVPGFSESELTLLKNYLCLS